MEATHQAASVICAFLLLMAVPVQKTLAFQAGEAPRGLHLAEVRIERADNGSAELTLTGRYSGFEKVRVYVDLTLKKGTREVGGLDLVPHQTFRRVITVPISDDLKDTRGTFRFGEPRAR